MHVTNAIVAGNSLNAGDGVAIGAGMNLAYEDAAAEPVTLTNVTMHGNSIVAAGEALGGALAAEISGTDALSVINTAIGASTATGTVVEGIAVYVGDPAALGAWSHNALIEEAVDCEEVESVDDGFFFGIVDLTCDDNGNVPRRILCPGLPRRRPTPGTEAHPQHPADAGAPEVLARRLRRHRRARWSCMTVGRFVLGGVDGVARLIPVLSVVVALGAIVFGWSSGSSDRCSRSTVRALPELRLSSHQAHQAAECERRSDGGPRPPA